MISVYSIAWIFSTGLSLTCGYLIIKQQKNSSRYLDKNNTHFWLLQKIYLFPHLIIVFAESLQAPYLYYLFNSYHYSKQQISILYVSGIVLNIICKLLSLHLSVNYGRKALCMISLILGSIGCTLKYFDNYTILLLGRLFDGSFSAIVSSALVSWHNHEHFIKYDFPSEWMFISFILVSLGSAFAAVFSGVFSEIVIQISRLPAMSFFFSTIGFILAGVFIGLKWPENKSVDAPLPFTSIISRALNILRTSPSILVLCIISSFMESAILIFNFVWAPLFIRLNSLEGREFSLGIIYSALLASYLSGSTLYSSRFSKQVTNIKIICVSTALALIALLYSFNELPILSNDWASINFSRIFIAFLVFQFSIGVYTPTMESLQMNLLPCLHRSAILTIARFPACFLSCIAITTLFSQNAGEYNLVFLMSSLIAICTTLSVVLALVLSKKRSKNQLYSPFNTEYTQVNSTETL